MRRTSKRFVSRHLGVSQNDLKLSGYLDWPRGTFNVCVPVHIHGHPELPRAVTIRFPQPYKVGEGFRPGNVEEKLRCEAANYIWLQKHCPTIPIPRLFAFGFPGAQSVIRFRACHENDADVSQFTAYENESLWQRLSWHFRRLWRGQALSPYIDHRRAQLCDDGYLIIEQFDSGDMLSQTWEEHRCDPERRANLFRGLSRILLALAGSCPRTTA